MNQTRIIFILVILVIGLVICTVFFANGMYKYYKAYLERGLYPNGNEQRVELKLDSLQTDIIIIGDSRSKHWDISDDWWNSYEVHKMAQSGFTSAQVRVLANNANIEGEVNCVILCMGINDLKAGYFFKQQENAISSTVIDNYEKIAQQFAANNTKIVVCNVFPEGRHGGIRRLIWPSGMQRQIESVNKSLLELCKQKGYLYLDAYGTLMDGRTKTPAKANYYKDFLHLNNEGYEALNKQLKKLLDGEA
ncbi:hypothetical protein KDU71_18170 [Carboxylicivirga sediminis]|uniref:SGNH hydrolase-type esterase domain-containing protein n=1 Tax=Carboxylicivirga sediminis TaxID=2006564 RepID=A0A941F698_9BACT|nr:GDSL-type esterase/lipase family protein [Carboxylicivirga sediminis]MBR8537501.1 hypothetical protein [Carboxylicivirga sediminis]